MLRENEMKRNACKFYVDLYGDYVFIFHPFLFKVWKFLNMKTQNKECLNAIYNAWKVSFPVIWQAFLTEIYLIYYVLTYNG